MIENNWKNYLFKLPGRKKETNEQQIKFNNYIKKRTKKD